ncbi:MAG: hypothetical protein R2911_07065 [Caldilineaceae bacterium]
MRDCIEDLGLSVTEAASILDVARPHAIARDKRALSHITGDGNSFIEGVWQPGGNVAEAANGLRPGTGAATGRRNQRQSCEPTRPVFSVNQ